MPRPKPQFLIKRHNTKSDKSGRKDAEDALIPLTSLPLSPPPSLKGFKISEQTWRRVVGLYAEIDGKIATSFDFDILVKYCLMEHEVIELAKMRDDIKHDWDKQRKSAAHIKPHTNNLKDWVKMWEIVNALYARYQGMDARLDGKRKLLLALAQSLYLTPRSRAGVEPPLKEPDKPRSEMDQLLD
jgi:phage terminase small subunit